MRRLARHAFTALSALSLLLCVAVCALWVRSLSYAEGFHYVYEGTTPFPPGDPSVGPDELNFLQTISWVTWSHGIVQIGHARSENVQIAQIPPGLHWGISNSLFLPHFARRVGLSYYDGRSAPGVGSVVRDVIVPFWIPTALTAVLPAIYATQLIRRRNSRRRMGLGLCPA